MTGITLTAEEKRAIRELRALAKRWPKTLWLYSGSGTLWVMREAEDGSRPVTTSGGVDPNYSVTSIDIPNDGGDW